MISQMEFVRLVDEAIWKKLTQEEKQEIQRIQRICDEKLESYFGRLK